MEFKGVVNMTLQKFPSVLVNHILTNHNSSFRFIVQLKHGKPTALQLYGSVLMKRDLVGWFPIVEENLS